MLKKMVGDIGAKIDIRGEFDRTPLHTAAYNGCENVVELLLNLGADPNAKTSDADGRQTPLHNAFYLGRISVLLLLLNTDRIDINALDLESEKHPGETSLLYAVRGGMIDAVYLITSDPRWKRCEDPANPNHLSRLLEIPIRYNKEPVITHLEAIIHAV